ncbi:putative O-spanin [Serratia phage vB_SmaS_Opt-155]|uniref:O-spanin n=1 Tax=Serratia phage vB_SmaS_Opt-155 TaxID=2902690 RepID=A0AC61TQ23_9CAUD|nr:putative O-spanin [Serratia phage vB_SmaS_Opt-155]UGO52776.1 putative O-spanin [Serratia phage vB_SmaS_Opt-155]
MILAFLTTLVACSNRTTVMTDRQAYELRACPYPKKGKPASIDELRMALREALGSFYWCADQTDAAIKYENEK